MFFITGKINSAPLHPIAAFEGLLKAGERDWKNGGREGKRKGPEGKFLVTAFTVGY